jgi:glycosyltransferase involved in cell wall biosynthesis
LVFTTLRMNVTAAAASYIQHHRPPLIARQANAIATDFVHLRRKSLLKHRVAEKVVKWLLKRPDALVAQSNDMAHELARHARNGQVVATIGNPISLSEIERNRAEQVANFTPQLIGSPSLIAVGRLSAQKGFDLLLPAFARLREEAPEAGLTILGEGPDRALLEAQVAALGLDASVRMPGHSETALAAIAAADLLVSSSRYEGFPNIVLEAMALGTPVVATDCEGGTKELVLDEKTGIIASDISVAAIHAALSRSLTSDLVGLSSRAQLHVVANFDKDLVIEKYAKLFLSFTPERGHDDM